MVRRAASIGFVVMLIACTHDFDGLLVDDAKAGPSQVDNGGACKCPTCDPNESSCSFACLNGCSECDCDPFVCTKKSCTVTCAAGTSCETTCAEGEPCSVACPKGAVCLCNGAGCSMTCETQKSVACKDGGIACNRECPE